MKPPPLLPEETLHRVLRVANFNGISVLGISGMLALAAASVGDYSGAAVGLLIAASGAFELHGAGLLRAGDARGTRWLIASQPFLLVVVLCYCLLALINYDPSALNQSALRFADALGIARSEFSDVLARAGYDEERLRGVYVSSYAVLGLATLIYQGLMTAYYSSRRHAVAEALEVEEPSERFN